MYENCTPPSQSGCRWINRNTLKRLTELVALFRHGEAMTATKWARLSDQRYETARQQVLRLVDIGYVELAKDRTRPGDTKIYTIAGARRP